ncbi:beta-galactosidase [Anaeromicropila populeti]|uniref:beta-galactosidase n=1 Tax=Anaeromicropila populeti TaxID=37658 RepID=A0A1I6JRC7_9FIRM|nr:beta-galactosidase [Anaeromicropila populeti]SFR81525.1 beta-galactosidase [Anaeromicropila populeti]
MKIDNLLLGTAYYAEYMPYERIEEDMKMMKCAYINVIRIAESTWSTWEPQDNVYDFSVLHQVIQAASKYDIQVIIGTPTYAVPAWLVKKHPDILAETHNGISRYGHRQNMDITNPHYLFYAERIIRSLMEQVKDYENVIGFQLDNETKSYDTCSVTAQTQFIDYLKNKYPNIDHLNKEFGLTYWSNQINSWRDFPDIRGTINASLGAEYEKFQRKLVTDFLSWQAEIVSEYKRPEQFITQNFDYDWRDYSFGLQPEVNQFEAAKALTIPGFDIYHPSRHELTGKEIAFGGSIGRGVARYNGGNNYLILETQAQGNLSWLPYEGQLRLQAYSHLANGANSVMYWHWHSIHNSLETYWKGILSHDLDENPTYHELCQFGQEWSAIGSSLKNLNKVCDVAIMIDNNALSGMKWFPIHEQLKYNDILRWLYDAFYNINVECDIIHSSEKELNKYKLIVVPALYSASETTLLHLDGYVKNGGHLLSTFKTGFSDPSLKVYDDRQPHLLTECFGMSYQQFTLPHQVSLESSKLPKDTYPLYWMELLCPDTAEIWASYHHPHYQKYAAITHNYYGKGTATYLGCYFDGNSLEKLLLHLLQEISISPAENQYPIIIKKGFNERNEEIIYYLNYSDQPAPFLYQGNKGTILLKNKRLCNEDIEPGTTYTLEPWNLIILKTSSSL